VQGPPARFLPIALARPAHYRIDSGISGTGSLAALYFAAGRTQACVVPRIQVPEQTALPCWSIIAPPRG
jgi:hypothetical protein